MLLLLLLLPLLLLLLLLPLLLMFLVLMDHVMLLTAASGRTGNHSYTPQHSQGGQLQVASCTYDSHQPL
jgi:hypothetical protein